MSRTKNPPPPPSKVYARAAKDLAALMVDLKIHSHHAPDPRVDLAMNQLDLAQANLIWASAGAVEAAELPLFAGKADPPGGDQFSGVYLAYDPFDDANGYWFHAVDGMGAMRILDEAMPGSGLALKGLPAREVERLKADYPELPDAPGVIDIEVETEIRAEEVQDQAEEGVITEAPAGAIEACAVAELPAKAPIEPKRYRASELGIAKPVDDRHALGEPAPEGFRREVFPFRMILPEDRIPLRRHDRLWVLVANRYPVGGVHEQHLIEMIARDDWKGPTRSDPGWEAIDGGPFEGEEVTSHGREYILCGPHDSLIVAFPPPAWPRPKPDESLDGAAFAAECNSAAAEANTAAESPAKVNRSKVRSPRWVDVFVGGWMGRLLETEPGNGDELAARVFWQLAGSGDVSVKSASKRMDLIAAECQVRAVIFPGGPTVQVLTKRSLPCRPSDPFEVRPFAELLEDSDDVLLDADAGVSSPTPAIAADPVPEPKVEDDPEAVEHEYEIYVVNRDGTDSFYFDLVTAPSLPQAMAEARELVDDEDDLKGPSPRAWGAPTASTARPRHPPAKLFDVRFSKRLGNPKHGTSYWCDHIGQVEAVDEAAAMEAARTKFADGTVGFMGERRPIEWEHVFVKLADPKDDLKNQVGSDGRPKTVPKGAEPARVSADIKADRGQIEPNLLRATQVYTDSDEKWAAMAESGASDDRIKEFLGHLWSGQFGAMGPDHDFRTRGGARPAIWFGDKWAEKPSLTGKPLIEAVRRLLEIPQPAGAKPPRKSPTRTFRATYHDPANAEPVDLGLMTAFSQSDAIAQLPQAFADHTVDVAGAVVPIDPAKIQLTPEPIKRKRKGVIV